MRTKWHLHTYKMAATHLQNGTCILTKWQLHTYKMASAYLQNDSYTLTKWHLQTYKMAATHLQNGTCRLTKWQLCNYKRCLITCTLLRMLLIFFPVQVFNLSGKSFYLTETSLGEGSKEICMKLDYKVWS